MNWYFPSWYGDFRLIETGLETGSIENSTLKVEKATLAEQKVLADFLRKALKKDWLVPADNPVLCAALGTPNTTTDLADYLKQNRSIELRASVAEAGKVLLKLSRAKREHLTAMKFSGGRVEVASSLEMLAASGKMEKASAAASVPKPQVGCPDCAPGAIAPASEVLQAFLTEDQHRDWAKTRSFVVEGGETGYRYLIAHRHSRRAAKQAKVAWNIDLGSAVCVYDLTVPPEEEALAVKLYLEHREGEVNAGAVDMADDEATGTQRIFTCRAADVGPAMPLSRRTTIHCDTQSPNVPPAEDHLFRPHPPGECWCGGAIIATPLH